MSKKRPFADVSVEPHLLKNLEDYVLSKGSGVFVTPAVKAGSAYPPVDHIVVAEELKKKYPFQYKRFKTDLLVSQVKRAHEILSTNFISSKPTQESTSPTQKEGKSVFDDDDDSDSEEQELPPAKEVDANKANATLRNMYNKSAVSYDEKAKQREQEQADEAAIPPSLLKKAQKMLARKQQTSGSSNKARPASTTSTGPAMISRPPSITYADLGGIEGVLQDIRELVEYPILHPEIYQHLGVEPPRGVLLHGPPGCGKTMLAHAIAGELKIPFLKISAPEVVSGMSGESESKIRNLFADALAQAPCILFIDEIDAIAPKRGDAQREMEKRIVAQLLTCMDSLSQPVRPLSEDSENGSQNDNEGLSVAEAAMIDGDNMNTQYTNSVDQQRLANGLPINKTVIVIGATNRPDSIDSALRRAGRFDREIALGIPDDDARCRILQTMCRNMRVDPTCDFRALTKKTVGYVGADLNALTREAAVIAVNRIFTELILQPTENGEVSSEEKKASSMSAISNMLLNTSVVDDNNGMDDVVPTTPTPYLTKSEQKAIEVESRAESSRRLREVGGPLSSAQLEPLYITELDFESAIKKVQPSAKREGFATIPDVTWQDVGALDALEAELDMAIVQPIRDPKLFESIGLSVPAGVLLFGPPGCGKTLVAKAVANQSGASFVSVKGPELLNQYVGQSEFAVRQIFQRARASSPCVIFFDELDALCPKRGNAGNQASERVVNQLLTELDGMDDRRSVFVIAATNRPDIIDPAMLRPGRLDKLLYISLPDAEGRLQILRKHVRRSPLADDVDLALICRDPRTEGFSGADMSSLVREATVQALREVQAERSVARKQAIARGDDPDREGVLPAVKISVSQRHFNFAFSKVRASVSEESRLRYDRMQQKLCQARSTMDPEVAPGTVAVAPTQAQSGDVPSSA